MEFLLEKGEHYIISQDHEKIRIITRKRENYKLSKIPSLRTLNQIEPQLYIKNLGVTKSGHPLA